MIIGKDDEGNLLRFTGEEWSLLLSGKEVSRITGSYKGYFKFSVKVRKIKDPYK